MSLLVMTYNIHHGVGQDKKYNLARIAHVLQESKADIIGLNEVDVHFSKRSSFDHQIKWLANQLGFEYAFAPALQKRGRQGRLREYGNALLSRYPILHVEQHRIKSIFSENRSLLEVELSYEQQSIKVYVSHLSLNPIMHRRQRQFILSKVQRERQPTIVMGDWNMRSAGRAWGRVNQLIEDVTVAENRERVFTFSSRKPIIQLDYIFASAHFQRLKSYVSMVDVTASDHLALIGQLSLSRLEKK